MRGNPLRYGGLAKRGAPVALHGSVPAAEGFYGRAIDRGRAARPEKITTGTPSKFRPSFRINKQLERVVYSRRRMHNRNSGA
jgi:hypothetical protein